MNFGEKQTEFSPKHCKEIPVWQSPKYKESKAKAEEIINSGKFKGVQESDFWILMNVTKSEKMAYTGLIISHNGCLKINDCLESKFNPACVSVDKDGYGGSLVYWYNSPEQGIYEVGEVSKSNCKNEYPYAMAYKRLFDRVVLKLSKLAYAGIYSDSEAEEFAQPIDEPKQEAPKQEEPKPSEIICQRCGNPIKGKIVKGQPTSPEAIAMNTLHLYGAELCWECACEVKREQALEQLK
ncbi:MAG: hypothetical protein J6S14_14790 [Clostridia bacterium]|nr:hypothetical protein [Clostridia bacterium]